MNHPITEGNLRTAWSLARALAIFGWQVKVLNFRYRLAEPSLTAREGSGGTADFAIREISMPFLDRESLFEARRGAPALLAALLETLASTRFVLNERADGSRLVHIVNCFRYCRFLWKVLSRAPFVLHLYQRREIGAHLGPLARNAAAIVASSRSVGQVINSRLGVEKHRITQIYPPIDTDVFAPVDSNTAKAELGLKCSKIILYMGNIDEQRFPDSIIRLLQPVFQDHKDTTLVIATTPTAINAEGTRRLLRVSKRQGTQGNLRLIVKNLTERERVLLYNSSKVFLFVPSSEYARAIEPPMTVMEALSAGVPVLATDVLSIGEVVVDGINGFLLPPNKRDDLPHYLNRLLSMDCRDRSMMSASARRRSLETFSLRKTSGIFGAFNDALTG
jgi:glycosyltransferase involved in cell wall biosynthesis